jgi:hypothetical protein
MRKCECGNDVANNARVCPKCGYRFTSGLVKAVWFLGIVIGLGLLGAMIGKNTSQNSHSNTSHVATPATTGNATQRTMTESERNYLGAAGSYLKTANEQGTIVARTMAGASDGSSTLGDIKTALQSARTFESVGYLGDYKNHINGNVPGGCSDLSKNIDETHRLFQAATTELLEYWKDQNTEHIVSGNATLKRSVLLMNSTISAATSKMKEFKPK